MKTKLLYLGSKIMVAIILVAVLAIKALAATGEGPKVKLIPYKDEFAIITVNNASEEISQLAIEDAQGDIVYYREGLKSFQNFYHKTFDLRNLNDGDYKVIVENKSGRKELDFAITDGNVKVENGAATPSPYFEVKEDVLKLSLLNHTLRDVKLSISNEDQTFFRKSLGDDFSITTGFNLEQLTSGSYQVKITSGDETFSYNFEK